MSVDAELSPVVLRHIERFIDKLCAEFGESTRARRSTG